MANDRPLVLLTGASAGIGEALARVIAADGCDLLLVARREERLRALAATLPTEAHVYAADLTDPKAPEEVAAQAARLRRPIDMLVNNAGFGHAGPFASSDIGPELGMIDLNVRALVELTHRLLPGMLARGRGGVLNVASTAAFLPGPNVAIYYASKAFVLSFSEALSQECRGSGVTITALCPGPTESEFGAVSGMDRYRLFRNAPRMTSAAVAEAGWSGFRAGRRVVLPGVQNRVTAIAGKLMPHRILLPIVKRMQS